MSMTLLVVMTLSRAPDSAGWQRAMTESRVPVQLIELLDLKAQSGFIPVKVSGSTSGFYFLREDFSELAGHYPSLRQLQVEKPVVYSLGYGAYGLECASALYAAAALVSRFGGVAFDTEGGQFMSETALRGTAEACRELQGLTP